MSVEKQKTDEAVTGAEAPADATKREVLAKLGKYAAYTAPVMLVALGASEAKAQEIGSGSTTEVVSDRRLKEDIRHLSVLADGTRLYSFRYLWSDETMVGVMAQDLLADPAKRHAVIKGDSGYYQVDYAKLGLRMVTLDDWNQFGLAAIHRRTLRVESHTSVIV